MEFRILGMLEVCDAGRPVEIGAAKERALLAELVLHANQIVSRDRLIEVVWGDTPPATAAATLNTYVSHLRSALEPGRAPRSRPGLLLTREPGYLLAVDPERVDALRFERLADEGRRELAAGDATTAAATLREGLGLWRGEALADFVYEPFAQAEATRLEELRLATLEQRVDADLALGRHHDLVAELRRLVDQHPLRERLWGQLMLALYRSGRQSEALRAYGELRDVLAEELGIDPSPALRRLEDDMLQQRLALDAPVGPAPAPVPAGPVGAPTNLPTRLTTFVGREDDIAEVARLCANARLVTLVGAGGVGKTRLAVEVASRLVDQHPDGVFLVELAPLSDAGGLYQQVLASVGVGEDDRRSPAETLAAYVAGRRILLLIDNCEHIVDACAALVEDLLTTGPDVRILATSRELLRIPVETAWRVPSMSTPPLDTGLEELVDFEAARLFLDRATTLSPGLELSKADAAHVARICARLEGIPLAIELAAARTRLLSIGEIAERLDDRFGLLSTGARTAPGRHQTLRAAVDWSYDSLTVAERRLFDLLSVFSGGFTLQGAEALCPDTELTPSTVLETLGNLADKSMVLPGPGRTASRFRMLETLRQYGAERLAERGGTEAIRNRHLGWAVALAADAEPHLEGAGQAEWLQRLADEHDNLRSALEWAATSSDRVSLLSLATALGRFWEVRGHLSEGRRWLEAALEAWSAQSAAPRARAHRWAGVLAQRQGDHHAARRHYEAGLALSRDAEDRRGTASALHSLGNLEGLQGRLDAATALYEESLGIGRDLGDRRVAAASLTNLGWIAQTRGDFVAARRFTEDALAAWKELGDQQGLAQTLTAVAYLALLQGDHQAVRSFCGQSLELQHVLGDRYGACWSITYLGWAAQNEGDLGTARQLHEDALAVRRELGDRYGEAWSLSHLGDLERAAGRPAEARRLLDQSLGLAEELGDTYCISWSLLRLAKLVRSDGDCPSAAELFRKGLAVAGRHGDRIAAAECLEGMAATLADSPGELRHAASLLGTAHALREAAGAPVPAAERQRYERDVHGVRERLGEDAFSDAWEAGRVAAIDDVVRRHALPQH
ncbi:MAG: BTAD domain-containing putative transcriptional regulator [Acidimicrobiales bacterium]